MTSLSRKIKAHEEILRLAWGVRTRKASPKAAERIRENRTVLHDALLQYDRSGHYEMYIDSAEIDAQRTGIKRAILFDPRRFAVAARHPEVQRHPAIHALAIRSIREISPSYLGDWRRAVIVYYSRAGSYGGF